MSADLHRLETLIRQTKRGSYLPEDGPSFASMATQAEKSLFQLPSNHQEPRHVQHHLCQECPS